jgi:hypothetical protein
MVVRDAPRLCTGRQLGSAASLSALPPLATVVGLIAAHQVEETAAMEPKFDFIAHLADLIEEAQNPAKAVGGLCPMKRSSTFWKRPSSLYG